MIYVIRFIAILGSMLAAVVISALSNVELFKVMSAMSLVLVVDTITVRYISNLYLQMVYSKMQEPPTDKKDT